MVDQHHKTACLKTHRCQSTEQWYVWVCGLCSMCGSCADLLSFVFEFYFFSSFSLTFILSAASSTDSRAVAMHKYHGIALNESMCTANRRRNAWYKCKAIAHVGLSNCTLHNEMQTTHFLRFPLTSRFSRAFRFGAATFQLQDICLAYHNYLRKQC